MAWERGVTLVYRYRGTERKAMSSLSPGCGLSPGSPFPLQQKLCMIMKRGSRQKTLTEGEKQSGQSHIITVNPL